MNQSQVEALRESFRAESLDLLSELETVLIDLEKHPGDTELTNRAFRALHSIKGSGAMFGFDAMSEFVHEIENVFDRVRKGQMEVTRSLIDSTLQARDVLLEMVHCEDPAIDPDPARTKGIRDQFRGFLGADSAAPPAAESVATDQSVGAVEPDPSDSSENAVCYQIRFTPPANLLQRGTDPVTLIDQLRQLGHCTVTADTSSVPPLESLGPDECYLSWTIALETDRGIAAIHDVFMFVDDEGVVDIERVGSKADPPSKQESPVNSPAVDETRAGADRRTGRDRRAGDRRAGDGVSTDTIRVPSGRLDSLVDLVGELVTVQARLSGSVSESGDPTLQAVSESVERLTNELRDTAMTLRMVPIGATFGRLHRLVRDLGNQLGKEATMETEGDETELDKTVIERLGDPLIHIVRNCIDHGLEAPKERASRGKPASGCIRLRAAHEGGSVVVSVSDDGSGLDFAKIRETAELKGIVPKDADLTEAEVINLIFEPGFSTATEITEVSGRGVGMDVVRRTIDSLGGSIETTSVLGQGTTVTLRLPLTLAIIDGILIQLRDQRYVIPLSAVNELIEVSNDALRQQPGRQLVELRGTLLPYMDLAAVFDVAGAPPEIGQIVVVDWDGVRVGLLVDQVIGQQQTVIKTLGSLPQRADGVSGATILGDGSVALILDVTRLIRIAKETSRRSFREAM